MFAFGNHFSFPTPPIALVRKRTYSVFFHWSQITFYDTFLLLHCHNQLYTYTRGNIVITIMTNETQFFRKIYLSHFIRNGTKGLCVRGELETEQSCNILTPSSSGYSSTYFSSCGAVQPGGPRGPSSLLGLVLTASNCNNWLQTLISN